MTNFIKLNYEQYINVVYLFEEIRLGKNKNFMITEGNKKSSRKKNSNIEDTPH